MAVEIERKFLVVGGHWRSLAEPVQIRQGYLARTGQCVVRVRTAGGKGWLTVKGRVVGIERPEYEVEVPYADAVEMLETLCTKPLVDKRRYRIPSGRVVWEVDEFLGENTGLVIAEVELESASQEVERPAWVGAEVTGDPRYYNSSLMENPYSRWT